MTPCVVPVQQDDTLYCASARPTVERSLVRRTGSAIKTLVYTFPRGVGVGCLRVLMEWVEWLWRVALFLANTEARPSGTPQT